MLKVTISQTNLRLINGLQLYLFCRLFTATFLTEHILSLQEQSVINNCTAILKLDYNILEINNSKGELSGQYPSTLLIPESDKSISTQTIYEHAIDAKKLRSLCKEAKSARCRTRFPIPVMIFRGKHICRSSTLSGSPEALGRAGIEAIGNFLDKARGLINGTPTEADVEPEDDLSKAFSIISSII